MSNHSNAYEIPGLHFTGICAEEISKHKMLAIDTEGNVKLAGVKDTVVGTSDDHRLIGQPISCSDGIKIVEAGEAINPGDAVMATDGKAMKLTSENTKAGICLTGAAASGQHVTVKLC